MQAIQTEQDHGFSRRRTRRHPVRARTDPNADADDSRDALFEHFNDEQVVEITLVAAMANFTNRFNNGLKSSRKDYRSRMAILSGIHPVAEALRAKHPAGAPAGRTGRRRPAPSGNHRPRPARPRAAPLRAPQRPRPSRRLQRHQGVVALGAARKYADLDHAAAGELVVVLDGVEDPHNLGAIIRTAHAAGAVSIVIPERRAAGVTDVVAKAAAGASNTSPSPASRISIARSKTSRSGASGSTALTSAATSPTTASTTARPPPSSSAAKARVSTTGPQTLRPLIRIPMAGKISSLNVSVAAGVVLFEWKRRRGQARSDGEKT